jgi:hypothetical protein
MTVRVDRTTKDLGEARDATEAVLARLDQLHGTSSTAPSNPPTP